MKIIEGFKLREVAGQSVVAGEGLQQIDFNRLIALNTTAAYLWKQVEEKEFTTGTLASLLAARYEVDDETALKDATETAEEWLKAGLITE